MFQESLLSHSITLQAGLKAAKSKGGEDFISQGVRISKARIGRRAMMFFANSLQQEKHKYVSMPLDSLRAL